VQRVSELEQEITGCHSKIQLLEEKQSTVNNVIDEHIAEKKKVI